MRAKIKTIQGDKMFFRYYELYFETLRNLNPFFEGKCNHAWIEYDIGFDIGEDQINFVCGNCNAFKKIHLPNPEDSNHIIIKKHDNVIYPDFKSKQKD